MMIKSKMIAGSVTIFVLLMLGLIIGMYLVGFEAPAVSLAKQAIGGSGTVNDSINASSVLDLIVNTIKSPIGLATIGTIVVLSLIATLAGGIGTGATQTTAFVAGSIVTFLIPVLILFAVANVFFFPVVPEAQAAGLPDPFGFLMTIVFNVLLLLAIVSWATGRD